MDRSPMLLLTDQFHLWFLRHRRWIGRGRKRCRWSEKSVARNRLLKGGPIRMVPAKIVDNHWRKDRNELLSLHNQKRKRARAWAFGSTNRFRIRRILELRVCGRLLSVKRRRTTYVPDAAITWRPDAATRVGPSAALSRDVPVARPEIGPAGTHDSRQATEQQTAVSSGIGWRQRGTNGYCKKAAIGCGRLAAEGQRRGAPLIHGLRCRLEIMSTVAVVSRI